MYKHVIFDCFGTLIDTGNSSIAAVEKILSHVNLQTDSQTFYVEWKLVKQRMMASPEFFCEKELFRRSLEEMFIKYRVDADAAIEVKPMIEILFANRKMFPDTGNALHMLQQLGVDCVIGSNTDTDSITYFLNENKLSVSKVFTSEDMKVYKPKPQFYDTILKQTGWDKEECLFVGDNLIDDVYGPQSIGMKAVLVDRKKMYSNESKIYPDYIVNSLEELLNYIS